MYQKRSQHPLSILRRRPHAAAMMAMHASPIHGKISLYQTKTGVLVMTELKGLPSPSCSRQYPVFSLAIEGKTSRPFPAGELPPIFGAGGEGFSLILSDRFTVNEIVGCHVVLHDEETGELLSCGEIGWC